MDAKNQINQWTFVRVLLALAVVRFEPKTTTGAHGTLMWQELNAHIGPNGKLLCLSNDKIIETV